MKPLSYKQYFESLQVMLAVLIHRGHNHEQRNRYLDVIQDTLEVWIKDASRNWNKNSEQQYRVLRELQALYALCVPTRDHETHTHVRNRLRLMDEMCSNSLFLLNRDELKEQEEQRLNWRISRGSGSDLPLDIPLSRADLEIFNSSDNSSDEADTSESSPSLSLWQQGIRREDWEDVDTPDIPQSAIDNEAAQAHDAWMLHVETLDDTGEEGES